MIKYKRIHSFNSTILKLQQLDEVMMWNSGTFLSNHSLEEYTLPCNCKKSHCGKENSSYVAMTHLKSFQTVCLMKKTHTETTVGWMCVRSQLRPEIRDLNDTFACIWRLPFVARVHSEFFASYAYVLRHLASSWPLKHGALSRGQAPQGQQSWNGRETFCDEPWPVSVQQQPLLWSRAHCSSQSLICSL